MEGEKRAPDIRSMYRSIKMVMLLTAAPLVFFSVVMFFIISNQMITSNQKVLTDQFEDTSRNVSYLFRNIQNSNYNHMLLVTGDAVGKYEFDKVYKTRVQENMNAILSSNDLLHSIIVADMKTETALIYGYGSAPLHVLNPTLLDLLSRSAPMLYSTIWSGIRTNDLHINVDDSQLYAFTVSVKENLLQSSDRIVLYNVTLNNIRNVLGNIAQDVPGTRFLIADDNGVFYEADDNGNMVPLPDAPKLSARYLHIQREIGGGISLYAVVDRFVSMRQTLGTLLWLVLLFVACTVLISFAILYFGRPAKDGGSTRYYRYGTEGTKNIRVLIEHLWNQSEAQQKQVTQAQEALQYLTVGTNIQADAGDFGKEHLPKGPLVLVHCAMMLADKMPFSDFANDMQKRLSLAIHTASPPFFYRDKASRVLICAVPYETEPERDEILGALEAVSAMKPVAQGMELFHTLCLPQGDLQSEARAQLARIRQRELALMEKHATMLSGRQYTRLYSAFTVGAAAVSACLPQLLSDTNEYSRVQLKRNTANFFLIASAFMHAKNIETTAYFYVLLYHCLEGCDNYDYERNVQLIMPFAETLFPQAASENASEALSENKYIGLIRGFINEQYRYNIGLDDAAGALGISKQHLCYIIKQNFDSTFVNLLNDHRINEACRLLRETDWPVAHIATEIGYSGSSYFISQFKNRIGMTPGEYRGIAGQTALFAE